MNNFSAVVKIAGWKMFKGIGKMLGDLQIENDKLKNCLTEIKEISENVLKNVSARCIETTPMYCVHKQILQKIREVGE